MKIAYITHTSPAPTLAAFAMAACSPRQRAALVVDGNVPALDGRCAV